LAEHFGAIAEQRFEIEFEGFPLGYCGDTAFVHGRFGGYQAARTKKVVN
jgi:hypothetical protein